jgi:outer membrane protein assembly factor BamB
MFDGMKRRGAVETTLVLAVALSCFPAALPASASATDAIPNCANSKRIQNLPVFAIALSARGNVCWEAPLAVPALGEHTAAPPVAASGSAFLDSDGRLRAVSLAAGRQEWTWTSGSPAAIALLPIEGATVVVDDARSTYGIAPQSGHVKWRLAAPTGNGEGPIPAGNAAVMWTEASGAIRQVVKVTDGRIRWQRPVSAGPAASGGSLVQVESYYPAVVGNVAISTLTGGGLQAVNLQTGRELWSSAGPALSATAAGHLVLLTSAPNPAAAYDVQATAVDPATGHQLWQYGPFDPGGVSFVEVDGALLYENVGTTNPTLARIDPTTGQNLWSVPTYPNREVAANGGLVGLEQGGSILIARNLATGAVKWQVPTHITTLDANAQLLVVQGAAGADLVVENGGELAAFSATDGESAWTVALPASTAVDGIVATDGGLVVQVSGDQYAVGGH